METYPDTRADRLQELLYDALLASIDPTLPQPDERLIIVDPDKDRNPDGTVRPVVAAVISVTPPYIYYTPIDPATGEKTGPTDSVVAFGGDYLTQRTRALMPYPIDVDNAPPIYRVQPADLVDLSDVDPGAPINRIYRQYWGARIARVQGQRRDASARLSEQIAELIGEYRRLIDADPTNPRFVIDGDQVDMIVATANDVGAPPELRFRTTTGRRRGMYRMIVCPECDAKIAAGLVATADDLGALLFGDDDGDLYAQAMHEHKEYCPARVYVSRETWAPSSTPDQTFAGMVRDIVGTVLIERGLIAPES